MRRIGIGVFSQLFGLITSNYYAAFDGVNDYMDGVNIPIVSSSFTIQFKVRRNRVNAFDWVIGMGTGGLTNQSLQIGWKDNNEFSLAFGTDNLIIPSTYSDTDWNEWVCTYDSLINTQRVYKNGIEVNSRVSLNDYIGTEQLFIGKGSLTGTTANIDIDYIKIWDVTASPLEVSLGLDLDLTNLLAEWNFSNNGNDDSGNLRHLAEYGGVIYTQK